MAIDSDGRSTATTGTQQDNRVNPGSWEREQLEKLIFESLRESRRARRWSIFFKLAMLAYLVLILVLWFPEDWPGTKISPQEHTALIEIDGIIAADAKASADSVVSGLRDAFENDHVKGVILRINSPGGSPVQAGYINDELKRLKEKHPDIPVYAVLSDLCASGAYYVAVAADKIYADKATMVGSIGVLMSSFGFVQAMDDLGIERRLMTAGEHKGFLDPFSPLKDTEVTHVRKLLEQIHAQFVEVVKQGRGDKLKEGEDLFSGLVWTGEQGLALGLIDGLGSSSYVARELIGAEKIVDYTTSEDLLDRLVERLGASAGASIARLGQWQLR